MSEPSIKRLFASGRITVDRLVQLSGLLGLTLAELLHETSASLPRLSTLTPTQEDQLVSDTKLLLIAVCALNQWSMADMVSTYRLTEADCLKRLLLLDRMGLVELMPGNRIRLRVARDFDWLADGPINRFFRERGLGDFLDHAFKHSGSVMEFAHGMLTESATVQLHVELRRLRAKLAALHEESAAAPFARRRGLGLLLASREWEPAEFHKLRRVK